MAHDREFVYKMIAESDDKKSLKLFLSKYFSQQSIIDMNYNSDIIDLLFAKGMSDVANTVRLTPFFGLYANQNFEEDYYMSAKRNYDKVIEKYNHLAKELNLNNSLELSILFSYMLYNGYFSITGVHNYQIDGRSNILTSLSFDVFHGRGTCINYSEMLTDIITSNGYDAATVVNHLDSKMESRYIPDIERGKAPSKLSIRSLKRFIESFDKKAENHACTLIMEKDKPYVFDSTNLTMFECMDNRWASNSLGAGKMKLNPYISYRLAKSASNYNAIEKLCLTSDYTSPYTGRDFIFNFENCVHYFNENQRIFTDFHEDIMGNITEIVKDTERAKSKRKQKNLQIK